MSVGAGVSQTQITAQAQPVAMDSDLSSLSLLTANIKAADKLSSVLDSTGVRRERRLQPKPKECYKPVHYTSWNAWAFILSLSNTHKIWEGAGQDETVDNKG